MLRYFQTLTLIFASIFEIKETLTVRSLLSQQNYQAYLKLAAPSLVQHDYTFVFSAFAPCILYCQVKFRHTLAANITKDELAVVL